jgi:hypothetical protein
VTNASNEIFPDKDNGVWVDDPNDGLPREPFVAGTDRMIDPAVAIFRTLLADSNSLPPPCQILASGTGVLAARRRRRQLVWI